MYFEIKTERLLIRPIGVADAQTVNIYALDQALTRYMLFLPNKSENETMDFLRKCEAEWAKRVPDYYEFAVTADGKQIGAISLYPRGDGSAELGWILMKEFHGRGYITEAAGALVAYAADKLGISSVCAHCDIRNEASEGVMKRLGMKLADSTGERYYEKNGETAGELMYTLAI